MYFLRYLSTLVLLLLTIRLATRYMDDSLFSSLNGVLKSVFDTKMPQSNVSATVSLEKKAMPVIWTTPQSNFSAPISFNKRGIPTISTGFFPDHCHEQTRTVDAFPLMLRLVQHALDYLADRSKTESFNRYFQPSHRRTVFNVFRSYFATEYPVPQDDPASPKFSNVAIVYGAQPFSDPHICDDQGDTTFMAYFYNSVPGASDPATRALLLCPGAFTETPNDLPEPGDTSRCSSLKESATYDMDNLSATLLHEFLHYRFLTSRAISSPIIDWNHDPSYEETKILPRTGYGPYRCFYLNQKSTIQTTPQRDPRLNADNYVWFALEVYWGNLCGRGFADPVRGET